MTNNSNVHNPVVGLVNGSPPPAVKAAQVHAQQEAANAYTNSGIEGSGGSGVSSSAPSQASVAKANSQSSSQSSLTQYSAGNVPSNAQLATKATANASYTSPSGTVYYYNVPSSGSSGGSSSGGGGGNGGGSSSSGVTATQSSSATGINQLPSNIQSQLQSGQIRAWVNPSTGQTFYAPNAIGQGNTIWVNGPTGSGPISGLIGGQSIQITGPNTTYTQGGKTLYSGPTSAAPALLYSTTGKFEGLQAQPTPLTQPNSGIGSMNYNAFGTNAKISFPNTNGSAFTVTVDLPNGNTFTYNGNVSGVPLGTINAQDQAVEQAWSAFQAAQSLQNIPQGSAITVTQSNNGLDININTVPTTTLPTQTTSIGQGITVTSLTPTAIAVAAAPLLNSKSLNTINPTQTYTSDGVSFTGAELLSMYVDYESQLTSYFTKNNPVVTVGSTTAPYNSLSWAQQQQYIQQQTDQYTQSLGYQGPGYYEINKANVYISNPAYYTASLNNGAIGLYEGTTAPQAPVTTPTFATTTGTPTIVLPQGWSTDSNGNIYVNGQAPTLQQSIQYANAYAQYLSWYQSASPSSATSTSGAQGAASAAVPPQAPNWYNQLATNPQGGVYAANLATMQYAPIAATDSFNAYAASLGVPPAILAGMLQQQTPAARMDVNMGETTSSPINQTATQLQFVPLQSQIAGINASYNGTQPTPNAGPSQIENNAAAQSGTQYIPAGRLEYNLMTSGVPSILQNEYNSIFTQQGRDAAASGIIQNNLALYGPPRSRRSTRRPTQSAESIFAYQ